MSAALRSTPVTASTRRTAWSHHARAVACSLHPELLTEAARNFECLPPARRIQLAREVAATRAAEFARGWRNVVMLAAGMKRRSVEGREDLSREPCVVFFVRRKWRRGDKPHDHPQSLPESLLTFTDGPVGRLLVAIPTDVQVEKRLASTRAQGNGEACVRTNAHQTEFGTLTALVRIDDGALRQIKALTAMHVLNPDFFSTGSTPVTTNVVEHAQAFEAATGGIVQQDGAPRIGTSSAFGGRLVPSPDSSFDAQLVDLGDAVDIASLPQMLQGQPISPAEPFVASSSRYDELVFASPAPSIQVLVPDNHPSFNSPRAPVGLLQSTWPGAALPLSYESHGATMFVRQDDLLELQFAGDATTVAGDSGAPVVIWLDDGQCTWLGMHVAADAGHCYIVPAWQLLATKNYGKSLPDSVAMTLFIP